MSTKQEKTDKAIRWLKKAADNPGGHCFEYVFLEVVECLRDEIRNRDDSAYKEFIGKQYDEIVKKLEGRVIDGDAIDTSDPKEVAVAAWFFGWERDLRK